jgi:hypothetical protein
MRRIAVVIFGVVVLLLVVAQLALPGIAEHRAEGRLERHGGTAHVSLSALPAVRLLFGDGDSLEVKGSGLELSPEERGNALDHLDGFGKVSVKLDHLTTGPFDVSAFTLARGEGEHDYRSRMSATTTATDVGRFLGSAAGGPFGALLGGLAGGSLPGGSTRVPVRVDALLTSRNGDVQVKRATGTVAGIPAGPLIEVVAATVARRL